MAFRNGYFGRALGLGMSHNMDHFGTYMAGGRSPSSTEREAVVYTDDRVAIEPLDKSSTDDPNRFYSACIREDTESSILVVSNGSHTNDIFQRYLELSEGGQEPKLEHLTEVLDHYGPEEDPINTPRIAGVITYDNGIYYYFLGLVVPEKNTDKDLHG